MKRKTDRKAFTLVELLVVIAILAILATVATVGYTSFIKNAHISNDETKIAEINRALDIYIRDNGGISGEQDLLDALALYEIDADTLTPESAQYGYHFWYNYDLTTGKGKIVLEKSADVVGASPLEMIASLLSFRASAYGDTAVSAKFAPNSARDFGNGYYFLDKADSKLADIINLLESPEMTAEDYAELLLESSLDKDVDKVIHEQLVSRLRTLLIVNENGSHFNGTAPTGINIVSPSEGNTYKINNSVDLSELATDTILIPEGVTITTGSLTGLGVNVTVQLSVSPDSDEAWQSVISADATTDGVIIKTESGDTYVFEGDKLVKEDNTEVTVPLVAEYGNKVSGFDVIFGSDANHKEITQESGVNKYYVFIEDLKNGKISFKVDNIQAEHGGTPNSSAITWSIKDPASAPFKIENGVITFDSESEAAIPDTITFTATADVAAEGCKPVDFEVHVIKVLGLTADSTPAASITLTDAQVENGFTCTFKVSATNNAAGVAEWEALIPGEYKKVSYSSSNEEVATVDADGVITFKGFGTVTITASLANSTATVSATIEFKSAKLEILNVLFSGNFLYRVGNGNSVPVNKIFGILDGADTSGVTYTLNIYDASQPDNSNPGTYAPIGTNSDFTATTTGTNINDFTIQFSKTGVAILELVAEKNGATQTIEIPVEVVDGKNATTAQNATGNNVILLNDVSTNGLSVSNGYTLFGNGFKVNDTRTANETAGSGGWITLNGGYIDNAQLLGKKYPQAVLSGSTNKYYESTVKISGEGGIYNSLVTGSRAALELADGGDIEVINTTVDGGAIANIWIRNTGSALLKNVTTIQRSGDTPFGLGIWVVSTGSIVEFDGYLKQYNWGNGSDTGSIPNTYSSIINQLFKDNEYNEFRYTSPDKDSEGNNIVYINTGILFFNDSENVSTNNFSNLYSDNNKSNHFKIDGIKYNSIEKSVNIGTKSFTGTLFAPVVSENTEPTYYLDYPDYETTGQYPIKPKLELNITDDLKDESADPVDREYFYYDTDTNTLMVYFKSESTEGYTITTTGENPSFKPIATNQFGNDLSITVTMGGVDYTGKNIPFTQAGNYTIKLTYIDRDYYQADLSTKELTYTSEIKVTVTAVDEDAKNADFTFYAPDGTKYDATTVVIDGKTYVMPDVSATETEKVMSTTINGVTVYAPYVECQYNDNSSDFNYVYPLLTGVNITDYAGGKPNGATTTYNKSTTDTALFGQPGTKFNVITDLGTWNYAVGTKTMTYKTKSGYGLCLWSGAKGDNITAMSIIGEFSYTDNAGQTYYYCIYYYMPAHDCPGCVTPETLITLADGSQVEVQHLTGNEELLVWNMFTGKFEAAPLMFINTHGGVEKETDVIHLTFSDNTVVKVIAEHAFFDITLNKYVYLDKNAAEYIGHDFNKQSTDDNGNFVNESVTLVDVEIKKEITTAWAPVTYGHLSCFVNGMLSLPGDIAGMFNYFEVNPETLTYDVEAMEADIEKYGILTYEEFAEYFYPSEFMYNAIGAKYVYVTIGKGLTTIEELQVLSERYSKFFTQE